MPTLPTLSRTPVSNRTQQVVRPVSGESPIRALEGLSTDINRQMEVRNADELAKAKNKYLLLKTEQNNAYNDDPDYETIVDRHSQVMNEGIAHLSAGFTDWSTRDQFNMEVEADLAQSQEVMKNLASTKYKDSERADINDELTILQTAAVSDDGDPVQIAQAIDNRLNAATDAGVMTAEEAGSVSQQFKNEVAVNKLKAMEPQARIDALTKPWVANIQPHVLKSLREEAEADLRLGEAQKSAKIALDAGLTRTEYLNQLMAGKGDPDLIQDSLTMYNGFKQIKIADEAENAVEVHEAYADAIRFGPITDVKEIFASQPQLWAKMSEAQKANLEGTMVARRDGTVLKYSDRPTKVRLLALKKGGAETHNELRKFFAENSRKLNEKDFDIWAKIAIGEEPEGLFSAQLIIEQTTLSMTDKERGVIYNGVNGWFERETKRLGHAPSDADVNATVKLFTSDQVYSRGIWKWLDGSDKPQDMDEEERVDAAMLAPTAQDRDNFIRLFDQPEQERLQVELFKQMNPEQWNVLYENFVQDLEVNGAEFEPRQLMMFINKMQSDPLWPPRK